MNQGAFSRATVGNKQLSRDREPDTCPLCHYRVDPTEHGWDLVYRRGQTNVLLECVYQCTVHECRRFFLAVYRSEKQFTGTEYQEFRLVGLEPWIPEKRKVAKEIEELSPAFVRIIGQAEAAEGMKLDEVAGVAYRKALEFLLKDYCIAMHPEKAEQVKKHALAACITEYVSDQKIKMVAERAAWLGNDETHYVRIWADKDIEDLKRLILLSENWIENELVAKRYVEDMQKS